MENLCCVCSMQKQRLISPDSMFPGINVTIRQMLDDLVHSSLYSTRVKLPNRVCLQCVNKLENAYVLKETFKESIANFAMNRESDKIDCIVIDDDNSESENETSRFIEATDASENDVTASNETVNDLTLSEINENLYQRRKFQCKICHRRYHLKGEWKTHEERHANKEKQYKCRECRLHFLTKKHWSSHLCSKKENRSQ